MADQWITVGEFDALAGTDVRQSLTQESSLDLLAFIVMGTAKVQGILRATGFVTPATVTCELCKLAVFAATYEMIAGSPSNSVALPDDWAESEFKKTFQELKDGDVQPDLALQSTGAAIGGWTVSSDQAARSGMTSTTSDACCPNEVRVPRATRCQLRGY